MPDSSQGTFISVETVAVRAGMWSSLLSGLLLLFNFRIYSKRVVLSNKKFHMVTKTVYRVYKEVYRYCDTAVRTINLSSTSMSVETVFCCYFCL